MEVDVRNYLLIALLLAAAQPCTAMVELEGTAGAGPVLAEAESEARTCLVLGEALGGRFVVRRFARGRRRPRRICARLIFAASSWPRLR